MVARFVGVGGLGLLAGAVAFPCAAGAQEGDWKDPKGMVQEEVWRRFSVPPAPVLSPEEALESFTVPPGFRVELVASEPLVGDPVEIEFDPDGRLWVVEMRGYMPNPDGTNETDPVGRIVVLEDDDGDGRMDRNTVFLDQLVMPRALAVLKDGVLVAEPPNLWFCKDFDGDLRCDERVPMDDAYASQNDPKLGQKSNPEHASNGLLWGMDNWIYSANHTMRFRFLNGEFIREPTIFRGQWGISQDNYGRLFYNSNSDHFRGDLLPHHYLARNKHLVGLAGANVRVNPDQTVWPGRITLGVNRGYRPNVLREDGMLTRYTGACGTLIYRGSNFPAEFLGDGFVAEPTGNFIRRNKVREHDGIVEASNAYDQKEFMTSTDERFRPVNLINGPDGCLYVVDLYRGLIQHRLYLTTFLRKQVEERGLAEPIGLGRIYRVVHESKKPGRAPKMSRMTSADLVKELAAPDAWRRDTAQRLLVERQDTSVIDSLRQLSGCSQKPLAQIHALWTLHGLGSLNMETVRLAIKSPDPKVRLTAIQVSEAFVGKMGEQQLLSIWRTALNDVPEVQQQLALSLGELESEEVLDHLKTIWERNLHHAYIPSAVLSSLYQRELEFLELILDDSGAWGSGLPEVAMMLEKLAGAIYREGDVVRIKGLLQLANGEPGTEWRGEALLGGMNRVAFKKVQGKMRLDGNPIAVGAKPAPLVALASSKTGSLAALSNLLLEAFQWPGKSTVAADDVAELTPQQQARFDLGKDLYLISCGACHQPHGRGQDGLAPSLLNSDWVLGSAERMARIVLHGLQGPIVIEGKTWDIAMPGLAVFDDEQLASIMTYVRREWGHTASPVEPELVATVRAKYADRIDMWTVAELGE
ncbi:MAG: Cytochrome c-552 [Verrucomicrobia subdivision 3 bacterium]|nr:Cytochrome c-552 [Limisphaerales bacterium]MCS1414470.1 Cytochrome c-552 [Limisphaerales bacterium]